MMIRGSLAAALVAALLGPALAGQETPANNRMVWFGIMPEPMPEAVTALALEASSQFLRPSLEYSGDGRSFARADGEDWQLTADWAAPLGPGRFNLRLRGILRSAGIADQAIWNYHKIFGLPEGGREAAGKNRLDYRLIHDGAVVAELRRPGFHVMDTDLAYLVGFGDRDRGARIGASLQLPTGDRHDWSGNGGLDGLVGAAAWRSWGRWRLHGQAERVFLGVPRGSGFQPVLARHSLSRVWAGAGYQGQGDGFWSGLGLDVTVAYFESPYRVGIPRVDRSGWQQHYTFSHRSRPRWRWGFSEDAGTYSNPDITAFIICRL